MARHFVIQTLGNHYISTQRILGKLFCLWRCIQDCHHPESLFLGIWGDVFLNSMSTPRPLLVTRSFARRFVYKHTISIHSLSVLYNNRWLCQFRLLICRYRVLFALSVEMESRSFTHRRISESTGCTKPPPDSTRCTSHWTPSHTKNQGQETVTRIYCLSHSSLLTHPVSLVLHKLPFKRATTTTTNPSQSHLHSECSVFGADYWMGGYGNPGRAPLPELQSQSWSGFHQ